MLRRSLGLNPWVLLSAPACLERNGTPTTPHDLRPHAALVSITAREMQAVFRSPRQVPEKVRDIASFLARQFVDDGVDDG